MEWTIDNDKVMYSINDYDQDGDRVDTGVFYILIIPELK